MTVRDWDYAVTTANGKAAVAMVGRHTEREIVIATFAGYLGAAQFAERATRGELTPMDWLDAHAYARETYRYEYVSASASYRSIG